MGASECTALSPHEKDPHITEITILVAMTGLGILEDQTIADYISQNAREAGDASRGKERGQIPAKYEMRGRT